MNFLLRPRLDLISLSSIELSKFSLDVAFRALIFAERLSLWAFPLRYAPLKLEGQNAPNDGITRDAANNLRYLRGCVSFAP